MWGFVNTFQTIELIKYLWEPPDNQMTEPDWLNREPTPPSEEISLPKESLMIGTSYPPQLESPKISRYLNEI